MTAPEPELVTAQEAVEEAVPRATMHTREWRDKQYTLVICVAGAESPQDAEQTVLDALAEINSVRAIRCGQDSHEIRVAAVS